MILYILQDKISILNQFYYGTLFLDQILQAMDYKTTYNLHTKSNINKENRIPPPAKAWYIYIPWSSLPGFTPMPVFPLATAAVKKKVYYRLVKINNIIQFFSILKTEVPNKNFTTQVNH